MLLPMSMGREAAHIHPPAFRSSPPTHCLTTSWPLPPWTWSCLSWVALLLQDSCAVPVWQSGSWPILHSVQCGLCWIALCYFCYVVAHWSSKHLAGAHGRKVSEKSAKPKIPSGRAQWGSSRIFHHSSHTMMCVCDASTALCRLLE